jgi:hypothetical protein
MTTPPEDVVTITEYTVDNLMGEFTYMLQYFSCRQYH